MLVDNGHYQLIKTLKYGYLLAVQTVFMDPTTIDAKRLVLPGAVWPRSQYIPIKILTSIYYRKKKEAGTPLQGFKRVM